MSGINTPKEGVDSFINELTKKVLTSTLIDDKVRQSIKELLSDNGILRVLINEIMEEQIQKWEIENLRTKIKVVNKSRSGNARTS